MLRSHATAALLLQCAMLSHAHAQFEPGQFASWSQDAWGGDPAVPGSGPALVAERFFFVYPGGGVSIGDTSGSGRSMLFTAPQAVLSYLPTSGANAPLNATLVDPTSTSAGAFGGHVLALQFDVDFANAGFLAGSAGVLFGDLTLVNMMSAYPASDLSAFNGWTVRQWLEYANVRLGTGGGAIAFDTLSYLTEDLTRAFENGQPSQFAQDHLRIVRPGDFDNDGDADGADFLTWQRARETADPVVDRSGNNDGVVDGWDLAIWASNFGETAAGPSFAVPEPAAWALGAMSLALFGRRQRNAECAEALHGP